MNETDQPPGLAHDHALLKPPMGVRIAELNHLPTSAQPGVSMRDDRRRDLDHG